MNLSKQISELLKYNECIIVPEFGGFISNYQPARFDAARNIFLPPSKEVIFNARINKNDGILINYLVESERVGYHQAQELILSFVDRINGNLNNGEKVEMEHLGTFELDRSGAIVFHPYSKFELIQAYGLTDFSIPTIFETKTTAPFQHQRAAVRAINNKRDFIKIAASIALILTLSLFPVKTDKVNLHSSVLNPMEYLMEEMPVSIQKEAVEAEQPVSSSPEVLAVKKTDPYILVGGCFLQYDNAIHFQNELIGSGHNSEILKLDNGFYRVIVDSYATRNEALNAMNAYRQAHEGSGVWVSTR